MVLKADDNRCSLLEPVFDGSKHPQSVGGCCSQSELLHHYLMTRQRTHLADHFLHEAPLPFDTHPIGQSFGKNSAMIEPADAKVEKMFGFAGPDWSEGRGDDTYGVERGVEPTEPIKTSLAEWPIP